MKRQEKPQRRQRPCSKPRSVKQKGDSLRFGSAHQDFVKRVLDDAAFHDDFKKQLRGPYSVALCEVFLHTPEVGEWLRIEKLAQKDGWDTAMVAALKNPVLSVRALLRHNPGWAFKQQRLADFVGRLVWYVHHGSKSEGKLAGDWLRLLLLEKKVGGGSPDRSPAVIRRWVDAELSRVNVVLSNENRILIRADWEEIKSFKEPMVWYRTEPVWCLDESPPRQNEPAWARRPATLDDKLEEVRRRHQRRCKEWVELDDIFCVIDREHESNRAYVRERAAALFQTTPSDIEKKYNRANRANPV